MTAAPTSDATSETLDLWELHRHTLDPTTSAGQVLKQDVTCLKIACDASERLTATFDLGPDTAPNPLTIPLRRHLVGSHSYVGGVREDQDKPPRYYTRIVHVDEPQLGVQALLGHLSRDDSPDGQGQPSYGNRDFFIATRESRGTTPFLDRTYDFACRIELPLQDDKPHRHGITLRLANGSLVLEPHSYAIELQALDNGGLSFRKVLVKGRHSIGGLVLPLDAAGKHLFLLCHRHLHEPRRHGNDTEGDVPGHPICTHVYTGIQTF